ncbi:hypothetical protein Vadar_029480 [Vaccinium darrowii]|uniref:Uncharacterized protein n=1 Tax=Vaccinium darrowii TaxID=229202 RepID=A0ACB7ZNF8_9ERIC|nr:hypothetical protein Vadar_029480 [Vaccinium darrowii]
MPLLDIPTGQPSSKLMYLQLRLKPCSTINLYLAMSRDLASVPKSFQIPRNGKNCNLGSNNVQRGVLVIRAGATLEPQRLIESNGGQDGHGNPQLRGHSGSDSGIQNRSSSEDTEQLSEREKLRQIRISTAKKSLTPWNKGRKLSAEARQRIKERTKLAMQNPQVRTKLLNLGHAQSKETRIKIGAGVRMWWKRHREKLMLQETCYFDWQNLIAEASRRGFVGQEELQWDSYKILSEQLEQERLESIELRKNIPKSLERRRKISEAITARWADPEWLERIELRKQARRLERNKKAPKSLEQRGKISEAITAKWVDPDGRGNPQLGGHSGSASGIQNQSSSEDSEQLSKREKLRRIRISTALKGLTPWNKGRKLSAEARQRIKERTKLAMQNPQVRTKLLNLGHAQSKETRIKIRDGVRMWWERHREKLMLQETCYFDWQNLIAEASRRGFVGQEELQWDSYKILSEQLEQERLESIELRRRTTGVKGNKNIPKSLEHRRKISEAITAKWADPEWLERIELRKQARRLERNKKAPKSLEQRGEISEAITAKWADPMDNFPTTGSVRTTLGERHRLAKSSLAFKSKKKLVPDYVEKYEQQQLSNQPVPEQVSPVPNQLENSTPLLDKTGVSK